MNRSLYKNRYQKWPSRENFLAYKKAKKYLQFFKQMSKKENQIMGSKQYSQTFLSIKKLHS